MSRGEGPDHAQWADSVGAYLLEALPYAERDGFERHVEGCALCRADVESLQVATAALPASVEPLSPPPALKARIMAVVEAEAQLLEAAAGPRADLPERARPRRRRLTLPSIRPAFALACAVALLVVGGLGGALFAGGERGPGTRTVVASVERGDASARLVVGDDASRLEVADLAEPPEGRVYQVWTLREGGKPVPSSALFVPRSDGTASVAVPGSLEGVDQVLVSHEPVGGSRAPTSTPFLSASPSAA